MARGEYLYLTLKEFCVRYRKSDFLSKDRVVQIDVGWYDLLCDDDALSDRLQRSWDILDGITSSFILDNYRACFKNSCPAPDYPLYDEVSFEPLDGNSRGELYFGIAIDDQRRDFEYEVFTARNDYETEAGSDDIRDIRQFINNWKDALQDKSFHEAKAAHDASPMLLLQKVWL